MIPATVVKRPDIEVREWPPNTDEGDLGVMYVIDVLGVQITVRDRTDGLYVHVDVTDADRERLDPELPLIVEVNNSGENEYT